MTPRAPARIPFADLRVRSETDDGGVRVGIAIDGDSHGSDLLFGVEWIKAGAPAVSWQSNENTFEAYYVQSGSLRISWTDPQAGRSPLGSGECFYFPPGGTYTLENVGTEDAFLVWAITPAMPESLP